MVRNETRRVDEIKFREDLYPRITKDPALIQKYKKELSVLPPLKVNQKNELIDGYNRLCAHIAAEQETVAVTVIETKDDRDLFLRAIRANAKWGKQLSEKDKKRNAISLFRKEWMTKQSDLCKELSVPASTMSRWLKEVEDTVELDRLQLILERWLSCRTEQEIATEIAGIERFSKLTRQQVGNLIEDTTISPKWEKLAKVLDFALHEDDSSWAPQIYSLWNFGRLTNAVRTFGSIPQEILDNLLYYYTKPFDVVFDPFGGGGMTIDVCRKRLRRYYISDLSPMKERDEEIRQHDITTGLPKFPTVPDLVFLDPPYWRQAKHEYSKKKTDLGNVALDAFLGYVGNIAKQAKAKWSRTKKPGTLALIIGPFKDNGTYLDLPFLCYERIKKYLDPLQRIAVPYSTEIHGGAYVKKAKEDREILYLVRDLMIFRYDN